RVVAPYACADARALGKGLQGAGSGYGTTGSRGAMGDGVVGQRAMGRRGVRGLRGLRSDGA
ncbi:unnamed protein product, partial [Closterium sp. NIES-54]